MARQGMIKYPYARPKAMEQFFNLVLKEQEWTPSEISISTLKTLAIAPSKESETIRCLKFLGVINDEGKPTEILEALRRSLIPTLKQNVLSGYEHLFDQIPKSMINQTTLVNFFKEQGYAEDTAEYQGVLFVYLCKKSGIDLPNADQSFTRARLRDK